MIESQQAFYNEAEAKALYIGFNRSYLNPFLEMTLRVIANVTKLDFFGPGFSTSDELMAGVERWLEKYGFYSFIVTDPYVFEYKRILRRRNPFYNDVLRFPENQYKEYAAAYKKFFMNYDGTRMLIGHWDIYGFPIEIAEELVQSKILILGNDISLVKRLNDIATMGEFLTGANDNWYNYVDKYRDKIISFPFFIHSMEFESTPLERRKYFYHVPGTGYAERKKAKELLGLKAKMIDNRDLLMEKFRWYFFKKMNQNIMDRLQKEYAIKIANSKICYASGSSVRANVRKYFEIPAKGALMLCQRCTGFDNLGFKDGHNCIVVEDNERIKQVLTDFDDEKYQVIASNGRDLIWHKHSEISRIKQFSESLKRILKNDFRGSYWENGNYKFW